MDNGASSYRRFLAGDEQGLVEIIRDYKDGLILYLNGYVQNIHMAEDLMEDTFVRLAVKKPRFSGKSAFKTWLYAIGRNIAVDHIRKQARGDTVSAEELSAAARDEQDLEREYIQNQQKIQLHRALRRLRPEYARALYLVYFEGFTAADAAIAMGKSKKQTENLIYRAKQSLKNELEKEAFIYEGL